MKKDHARDIAEDGFADYAKWRGCTRERCVEIIRRATREQFQELPPDKVMVKADEAVAEAKPLLDSIEAVHRTFDTLRRNKKEYIIDAVEFVYCSSPNRKPARNEISMRIRAYAMRIYADDRTVYRWLREARNLYAYYLGVYAVDRASDWLKYAIDNELI